METLEWLSMINMVNLQTLHLIILSDSSLLLETQLLAKVQQPQMEIRGSTNSLLKEVGPRSIKILSFTQYGPLKE
jgi:hypothetical protein